MVIHLITKLEATTKKIYYATLGFDFMEPTVFTPLVVMRLSLGVSAATDNANPRFMRGCRIVAAEREENDLRTPGLLGTPALASSAVMRKPHREV